MGTEQHDLWTLYDTEGVCHMETSLAVANDNDDGDDDSIALNTHEETKEM